jgi:hypothetical protein
MIFSTLELVHITLYSIQVKNKIKYHGNLKKIVVNVNCRFAMIETFMCLM